MQAQLMSGIDASARHAEPPGHAAPGLYQYTLWSKETKQNRKAFFNLLILPLMYNALLMWACLSMYWGSLIGSTSTHKISVTLVNLDGDSFIGRSVTQSIQTSSSLSGEHLDWVIDTHGTSSAYSRELIRDEKTWAVVEVSTNASSTLEYALQYGKQTYMPQNTLTLYIASARNQITTLSITVPAVIAILEPVLSQLAINHTAAFLQSALDRKNQTAVTIALGCPQCLASPFVITIVDLVPFDPPLAIGAFSTGLIFLLTFTFNIFQFLRASAEINGSQYRFSSAIIFRTVSSLACYLLISLMYSLIVLSFGVPVDRRYGPGGFMVLWMLNWFTMSAVGLPMESLFTVIGMNWAGYFLNVWLIVNTSGSLSSFELMPRFYQYGYSFPFFHTVQGARTIIFGTKSHLGLNFGVLVAWMLVGLIGIYAATFWRIKKSLREGRHMVP